MAFIRFCLVCFYNNFFQQLNMWLFKWDLTSQHKYLTSRHKELTSQHKDPEWQVNIKVWQNDMKVWQVNTKIWQDNKDMKSQHKDLTSQHKDMTSQHKGLTKRHEGLTSHNKDLTSHIKIWQNDTKGCASNLFKYNYALAKVFISNKRNQSGNLKKNIQRFFYFKRMISSMNVNCVYFRIYLWGNHGKSFLSWLMLK